MPEYNKLVRDGIPGILRQKGLKPVIGFVSGKDLEDALMNKIMEEAGELLAARISRLSAQEQAEELGDLMEVIYALGERLGFSHEKLDDVRQKKLRERGGFNVGIVLVSVHGE